MRGGSIEDRGDRDGGAAIDGQARERERPLAGIRRASAGDFESRLEALLDPARRTPDLALALRTRSVENGLAARLRIPGTIDGRDLHALFEAYDREVLADLAQDALAARGAGLILRMSSRMVRNAGLTYRFEKSGRAGERYEIAFSIPLLLASFTEASRTVTIGGIVCGDSFTAFQRILEHELVHLLEFLIFEETSCSTARFHRLVHGLFGHLEASHDLITTRERAIREHGIRPGCRVGFVYEGRRWEGIVQRVTRRATVLVRDEQGTLYSDGNRYLKFYLPLGDLEHF